MTADAITVTELDVLHAATFKKLCSILQHNFLPGLLVLGACRYTIILLFMGKYTSTTQLPLIVRNRQN